MGALGVPLLRGPYLHSLSGAWTSQARWPLAGPHRAHSPGPGQGSPRSRQGQSAGETVAGPPDLNPAPLSPLLDGQVIIAIPQNGN